MAQSEKVVDQEDREECETTSDDPFEHIMSCEKRTDVLGFDRKSAMDKILKLRETSHPTHEIRK